MKKLNTFFFTFLLCLSIINGNAQVCTTAAVTAVPANSTSSSYADFLNTIVRIDGDFVVNTSFTIAGSEIRIAPGATITVQNGAILRINNSDLFTCGNLMWKGIVVQPNGTLQLSDNAIIQDAEIAVYSQAGGLVVASNALFNKNYKHFYADAFAGTHPASFTNNVRFYCQSSTNSPGNSLDINSFGATRTYIGIHADQVNLFTVGSQIGVSNKFDNADIGILSDNSSIEVYNNEFRNMVGPLTMAPPFPLPNINVAIEGYSTNGTHTAIIGGSLAKSNKIIDCRRGMFFRNFLNVEVSYNTLFTTYTSPTAPSPPTPIVGETGIAASHSPTFSAFKTTFIHHNDIKDYRTAIYYSPDTQGNMAGNNLNISNNTIEQTFNTIGVTGIYIVTFFAPLGQAYANSWIIRQNAIKKVTTGIYIQNILRANGTIRDNVITLKNGSFRNGIRLVYASRFSIWNNKIFGDGTTVAQINHTGIQIQDCSELSITCNRIFSIGRSMMFLHLNQKLNVFNNRFFGAYDGLVLKDNGIIGQQGYLGNCSFNFNDLPSDNMWIGNFTNSETYILNTTGANSNSILTVRTSPPNYLPTNNQTNGGLGNEYIFGTGLAPAVCPPQATVCPWFFNLPIAPPGGDNMSKIAREQIPYFIFGDTDKWRSKKKVLELIDEDPNLLLNPVLDSFKTANSVSGDYFEWSQIEQLLVNSDWANAETANQSIAVNGLPEEYLQEVYRIFININQGESTPNSDINLLETIASTCPLEGGYAVYGARGLLNVYFGNLDMFENTICEDLNQSRSLLVNDNRKEEINIFPNPSKGNFSLTNLPEKANTILIKDISGKVIYAKSMTTNESNKIDIDLPNCESGLYFYLIICEGQAPLTGKFIIAK